MTDNTINSRRREKHMKRFLTILTVLVFLLPAVGAARAVVQSPFCDALMEVVSSFSFEDSGCRMDVSVQGQEFSGTLQAGDGIWEINLGPWGKAQLSNDQLVYLYGDVDLSNAVYLTSDTINAFVGILQYAN